MKVDQEINIIHLFELFEDSKYEIPIYQRNYAWGQDEIYQLIDDIRDSQGDYYLGNLIVDQKDLNVFEVIDGQQRLTTLYLLGKVLGLNIPNKSLYFEARRKSNITLKRMDQGRNVYVDEELESAEIVEGYNLIKNYFQNNEKEQQKVKERLNHIKLIRIQVPRGIDLNHYFEIMNTRGEQLELHEIAKAKLLSQLSGKDKKAAAIIWDSCVRMDSYLQMNFTRTTREKLFCREWKQIIPEINSFDAISHAIDDTGKEPATEARSLLQVLENPEVRGTENTEGDYDESQRFESIIKFPVFLLHVNKLIAEIGEDESSLDDKEFLKQMKHNWANEESAKLFIFTLFKSRFLFDQYVVKREFIGKYAEEGKWSLQKLVYNPEKQSGTHYVGTFNESENKIIRNLESCLRVTYTSPKTMHWITVILIELLRDEKVDLKNILENYAKDKIKESNYKQASGFEFERIVFTYLDYIIYRDGYSYKDKEIISKARESWEFKFRNSIEHFYPQNPTELIGTEVMSLEAMNSFGNLALITVSGNSKFSNLPPKAKVNSYPSIFGQSLKLEVMKWLIEDTPANSVIAEIEIHNHEMLGLLDKELATLEE